MNSESSHGAGEHAPVSTSHPTPDVGPDVVILVNNEKFTIHRGHQTVAHIKTVAGVPLAHELEQIVDGKMIPLPDDGGVTLKGGEVFVSHPRSGQSS